MYNLPTTVDPNKIFLINRSELEGRIDAAYIAQKLKTKRKYNYPTEKLNKLVRSLTGGTPSKEKPEYWDGGIYWVSPKDFKQFYIDKSEDTITELGLNNSSTKLIPANSILIVVRSGVLIHTLPVAINTIPVTINQDIKALIPTNKILPEYLGYYFNVFNRAILPLIVKHSTTVQSVNTNEFDRLEIPVPPIKDQQLIVNILNCGLSAKQQKEAEAKALLESINTYLLGELGISLPEQDNSLEKRIFTSRFSEIGGGRVDPQFFQKEYLEIKNEIVKASYKRLSQLVHFSSETWNQKDFFEEKFPYIEISEIELESGVIKNISWINKEEAPSRAKMIVRENDIIISTTRPHRGAISKIQIENHLSIASTGFAVIRGVKSNRINLDFLFSILRQSICLKQMQQRSNGGNYPAITQEELGNLLIPLPSLEKQTEIANHIQNIRSQAKALQLEAASVLEEAKREVEKMILGE